LIKIDIKEDEFVTRMLNLLMAFTYKKVEKT